MIVDLQHEHHHPAPAAAVSAPAPKAADPHAGHSMHGSAPQAAPAADPHAGHHMHPAAPTAPASAGATPAPPIPTDHAAERFYSPSAMAAARAQLMK